jgi:hypothetical protein
MRNRTWRRSSKYVPERDMRTYLDSRRTLNFRPHCFVQSLALMESRRFDDAVALARVSDSGEES